MYRKPFPATWRCQCPRATPDLSSWVRAAEFLLLAGCHKSSKHSAACRDRKCPDTAEVFPGCAAVLDGEWQLVFHQSWSDRALLHLQEQQGGRTGHTQLYSHVSCQGLCHAGPADRQSASSEPGGTRPSRCPDASRSDRPRGRREEEKTTQKPEVISLASAENLPPVPHFALGCRFLKFSSLQEVQLLSRSA